MQRLDKIVPRADVPRLLGEIQEMAADGSSFSVAAIQVLKNELEPAATGTERQVLFQAEYIIPGRLGRRLRDIYRGGDEPGLGRLWANFRAWLGGADAERFRDRCDAFFWEELVPDIEKQFGPVAEPFMNTINEAIINYAEYSFRRWAALRRITTQIFLTEDELAYGIVRPYGLRLRLFDPLKLKEKQAGTIQQMKRGWGHTLLMRRALFISFDHSPTNRGLMIIVGPEND
ncbi:MAG: hypothetical protein ACE5EG_08255 [Thermoanaerobaculia bacterium]